jgi:hypothetical protein
MSPKAFLEKRAIPEPCEQQSKRDIGCSWCGRSKACPPKFLISEKQSSYQLESLNFLALFKNGITMSAEGS